MYSWAPNYNNVKGEMSCAPKHSLEVLLSILIGDVQNNIVMQLLFIFFNWMTKCLLTRGEILSHLTLLNSLYLVYLEDDMNCACREFIMSEMLCEAIALQMLLILKLVTISKWHKLISNKLSWSPLAKMLLKYSEEQGENCISVFLSLIQEIILLSEFEFQDSRSH